MKFGSDETRLTAPLHGFILAETFADVAGELLRSFLDNVGSQLQISARPDCKLKIVLSPTIELVSASLQSSGQLAHPPKYTEPQSLRTCWVVPSIYIEWDKLPLWPKVMCHSRRIPVTATTLPAFVDSLKTRPCTEGLK
jgi:hypothetical protein